MLLPLTDAVHHVPEQLGVVLLVELLQLVELRSVAGLVLTDSKHEDIVQDVRVRVVEVDAS